MRRVLPSLGALTVFEAAARHSSFTRAAEELGLAQSSVSRQVSQLEAMLKVKLFERVRRSIVLTPHGKMYAARIGVLLDQAQAATLELIDSKSSTAGVLHISSLGTLASHWLGARIGSFSQSFPDIAIEITTSDSLSGFSSEDIDVAIYQGEPSWPAGVLEWLMDEELVPLCSPSYMPTIWSKGRLDWKAVTLLQHKVRPEAWPDLLSGMAVSPELNALRGPRFSTYAIIIEATLAGLGLGAIPRFLVGGHIASGSLVQAFDKTITGRHSYYLVYPEAKKHLPKVKAFRSWIIKEAKIYRAGKNKRPANTSKLPSVGRQLV